MRSAPPDAATAAVEVTNISPFGVWLLVHDRERFLDFARFPWFRQARISSIFKVERVGRDHLSWPDLDVDICLDCIDHPEAYPLVDKVAIRRHARGGSRTHGSRGSAAHDGARPRSRSDTGDRRVAP